ADNARRVDERCRPQDHAGVVDGQAVHQRGCSPGRQRSRADPRRLWLHQGLSGREVLSRREAVHHRRRHQRDPALGYRPTVAEGLTLMSDAVPGAAYVVTQDERTMATLAHLLQLVTSWMGPLVIFFVKRDSPFVKFHALQALILQVCLTAFWIVGV